MKSKIFILIIFLIGAGLGYYFWPKSSTQSSFQTTTVKRDNITETVTASGNLAAKSQVSVFSPITGVISDVYIKNGDSVKAGDKLFKLKSTATDQEKTQAYAAYLSATNSYQSAIQSKISAQSQLEVARKAVLDAQTDVDILYKNLAFNNPSTKQPYTELEKLSIESTLTSARQNFTALEKKFNDADASINAAKVSQSANWYAYKATTNSEVKSPTDGLVANLSVNGGDTVTANTTAALVVIDLSGFYVKSEVNEVDAPKIKPGQKVSIAVDALKNSKFAGVVDRVDLVGTNTQGVVSYSFYVTLEDKSNPDIRPGMSVSLSVETAKHENVLLVPSAAVKIRDSVSTVTVLQSGEQVYIPVKTGLTAGGQTEIIAGLSEGEEIVTGTTTVSTKTTTGSSASPFGSTLRIGGGNVRMGGR